MVPLNKLLIFIGILVVCLAIIVVYIGRDKNVEGFGALDNRNDFATRNNDYFGNKFNRAVFYNGGLESVMKDAAKMFNIVDPTMAKNGVTDISSYFDKDPFPGIEARNAKCEGVLEPRYLPERDIKTGAGCGWWYVDDDSKASVGANGTEAGAYNNDGLEKSLAGGKWLWDLKLAQKMEDVKRCRRIKTCDTADLVPGRCGFCPALNTGVPVLGNGVSVYEEDPALNCGASAILNPAKCPRPEAPATPDGAPQPQIVLLCDPNPATGKLSNECLISLAKGAGLTDEGAVIHILNGDSNGYITRPGPSAVKFDMAKRILKADTSIAVNNEFLGIGSCTRSEALGFYNTLFRLARTASTANARNSAGFLAFGKEFDECDINDGDNGPFEQNCLERVALEAGCQADGTDFPKAGNKGRYDGMLWKQVRDFFTKLRGDMNSSDIQTQIDTTKRCLGVTVAKPAADCGDFAGLSMYVYRWEYEWDIGQGGVPGGKLSRATFFGRVVLPTYPEISNNGAYTPWAWLGTDRIYLRFRAKLKSKETITTRFWVYTDDGIALYTGDLMNGGKSILRKWWDQGPTPYDTDPFLIRENQPLEVTTDWFNNYGGYVALHRLYQSGSAQPVPPSMVEQVQPTGFPIARWDFYEGIINDRCRVLDSQVFGNVPIVVRGGMKGAHFTGADDYIKILNPICTTAFKSITMMMYVGSNPGPWPRPWEFDNSPLGSNPNAGDGNWCQDSLFGCISPNNNMGIGFYSKMSCGGPEIWTGGGTMGTQKWFHVAWVLDDDLRGMSIYIDGALQKRFRSESFNLLQNKTFRNCYIFQSVERFYKDVCVAWFRIFDYSLTKDDVALDRRNGWYTKDLFPPSPGTGWDRNSMSYTQG